MKKILQWSVLGAVMLVLSSCTREYVVEECYHDIYLDFGYSVNYDHLWEEWEICASDASVGVPRGSEYEWYFNGGWPHSSYGTTGHCSSFDRPGYYSITMTIILPDGSRQSIQKDFELVD